METKEKFNMKKKCPGCDIEVVSEETCADCAYRYSNFQYEYKIGGWLILPAITLVFAIIFHAILSIGFCATVFKPQDAQQIMPFAIGSCVNLLFLVFCIYLAILFFTKKRNTPKVFIVFMIATIVVSGINILIGLMILEGELPTDAIKRFTRCVTSSIIWIPYFIKSARVKATFIK